MGHHHEYQSYQTIIQCSHQKLLKYVSFLDVALNNFILLTLSFICSFVFFLPPSSCQAVILTLSSACF
jgi:hypothetical protein